MNVSASEYRQSHLLTGNKILSYKLWIIDDPHRGYTKPLSLSFRVKGFNAVPYCLTRSSKFFCTGLERRSSFTSSTVYSIETSVANLFLTDETNPPVATNAVVSDREKLHRHKAIGSSPRHPTLSHPIWTLIPPLIPYDICSFCSRVIASQPRVIIALFHSKAIVRFSSPIVPAVV